MEHVTPLRISFQGLLGLLPEIRGYEGFYYRDAAGVGRYGLEGLSMDIMEKIKRASGYPLDVNLYSNMLSAQSRGFQTKLSPYKSVFGRKGRKKDGSGSRYRFLEGGLSSDHAGKMHEESAESGKKGKEKWHSSYDESSGSKGDFMKESEFTDDYYHKEEEEEDSEFKGARKRNRAFLSKGYEDVYRRDETKKADSFWDKEEKEGKWFSYGSKKKGHEKKTDKKTGEKERSEEKEGGEYKSSKVEESEKKDKKTAKKERKNSTKGEYSEKSIEHSESKS
ncbi:UNVERIFIED_CONTAM: hypothetical protein PYX00_002103 [Menopon gallinae]|uniref:Uncharacterized protein n=1 Tax=Menopon gallinae TaxID=328185 RepID=A0AAW2IF20_9NEOP